ncbi:Calmodulin-binding protein 25 [Striga hermonthica]|uniref:Calmodulin-binding protein 25 n=1 Tax=Striga hermonthica TaxID=68872 RepID=A0A9N7MPF2_STRHE|nr:Calmodulin-binding protein 25 [Striga hermonthica]
MASSDNLMTMEQPWGFRPTFTDAWISDIYAREADTLTKALQMVVDRLQMGGLLPTFDTSAFLLDSSAGGLAVQQPAAVATDGGGLEFDPFCSFPTLESWKVM